MVRRNTMAPHTAPLPRRSANQMWHSHQSPLWCRTSLAKWRGPFIAIASQFVHGSFWRSLARVATRTYLRTSSIGPVAPLRAPCAALGNLATGRRGLRAGVQGLRAPLELLRVQGKQPCVQPVSGAREQGRFARKALWLGRQAENVAAADPWALRATPGCRAPASAGQSRGSVRCAQGKGLRGGARPRRACPVNAPAGLQRAAFGHGGPAGEAAIPRRKPRRRNSPKKVRAGFGVFLPVARPWADTGSPPSAVHCAGRRMDPVHNPQRTAHDAEHHRP